MNSSKDTPASSAALPNEIRCSRKSSSAMSLAAERDGSASERPAAANNSSASSTFTVLITSEQFIGSTDHFQSISENQLRDSWRGSPPYLEKDLAQQKN